MKKISYSSTGVNYRIMDPLKQLAQLAGAKTDKNIFDTNFSVVGKSKGESAAVIEQQDSYLAFVQEGLGTKNLIADAMEQLTGKSYYQQIAQDAVAAIVNDLITVGARPLGILAYWAAGDSEWFGNEKRMRGLIKGWEKACTMSMASWIGGETPTLSGIIDKKTIDIGGSAFGIISPKSCLTLGDKLQAGDIIILCESSGIHANGLSLARKIAKQLPDGYLTKLPNGQTYGEALLTPSLIYVRFVEALFAGGVDIHYMVHITGHGWRKLMRHTSELTYRIRTLPPVPEILEFLAEEAGLDARESYGTFNMGAGFAIFISQKDAAKTLKTAYQCSLNAYNVGIVASGPKQLIIEPLGVTFEGKSLQVRA